MASFFKLRVPMVFLLTQDHILTINLIITSSQPLIEELAPKNKREILVELVRLFNEEGGWHGLVRGINEGGCVGEKVRGGGRQ